ncbi:MAG: hypothetical protein K9L61_00315 [Candidatus Omnitrophica bacterium]|nr:hypothetical protein [Candidatus Omnitrophota bacterium]
MNKKNTFTLIEIMVSFTILITALTGIFLILNTGETFSPINLGRADVAAKTRVIMNRIVNDLRGAVIWEIANNNPSCTYLKFRKTEGIDTSDGSYILSANYVEYSYDLNTDTLSRSEFKDGSLNTVGYRNITENVFYILNSAGEAVCLNGSDLLSQNFIIVNINLEEQAGAVENVGFSLTQKVKIRNE